MSHTSTLIYQSITRGGYTCIGYCFPHSLLPVNAYVRLLVDLSLDPSYSPKRRKVTLPCFYWSTCPEKATVKKRYRFKRCCRCNGPNEGRIKNGVKKFSAPHLKKRERRYLKIKHTMQKKMNSRQKDNLPVRNRVKDHK